jgi:RNA polymerase sigma factor (sigma-70 family)
MATGQLNQVIETLRGAAFQFEGADLSDGELLESFLRTREEAAFAALVHRHGAMVWGVCRRLLRAHQDAEDAFQATFLVLLRKASGIAPKNLVANWLYGVARQTALKARATLAKRSAREKQVTTMPEPLAQARDAWDDLQPVLDQELGRLPDKYRVVIVLCDLEGKSRKDAARHCNVPEGTIASRLATARTMLAKRLSRSGLKISGGALAAALSHGVASANLPVSVASLTIKAASLVAAGPAAVAGCISAEAVALAEGVLKTMLLNKLKIATAVVVAIGILGAGGIALTQRALADKPAEPPAKEKPAQLAQKPAAPPATENRPSEVIPTVVNGVVKSVDAAANTVTVTYGIGDSTFTLAKDAKLEIDGKPGQLASLPAGADIRVSQFTDATTARSFQANGHAFFGNEVKAVDAGKKTITIQDRDGPKTFTVAANAFINVDGKVCELAAVPVGSFVNLGVAVDQQTVLNIGATGPGLGECGGSMIKAVDTVRNTITFDDKAHASVAGITYTLAPNANIIVDGRAGKLGEITPGCYLNATLTADQRYAGTINANGGPLDCDCGGSMVKAVDPVNYTITFDDKSRAAVAGKTFTVAKDALFVVDGRTGTFSEISPGAYIFGRLRVDKTTVGTLHANGPGTAGVVKSVDAANSTITVDDKTYPVAKDALIVIDGKQGPLASVPTGVNVSVNLRVDLKTVGMIQTRSK